MPSLESLLCNSCGAPLSVPAAANYIKCNHCQSQLHVRRDEDVTFTESVEQLNETTEALRQQVERLTSQQELSELDRRWESRKEEFMITSKHGHKSLPTETSAMVGGVVVVVFGLIWMVFAFGITSRGPASGPGGIFPLFGLLFIGFGIYNAISAGNKANDYKKALAEYQRDRAKLTNPKQSTQRESHE